MFSDDNRSVVAGSQIERNRSVGDDRAADYIDHAIDALQVLRRTQLESIRRAGDLIARSWLTGGCLFVSRTGHTLHSELVGRAGGPVAVLPLVDDMTYDGTVTSIEGVGAGDVVLINANYAGGRKATSIASCARKIGAPVIGLTQLVFGSSRVLDHRYSTAPTADQWADVVVDLGGVDGDAVLDIPGSDSRMCPLAGAVAVTAAWATIAAATDSLISMNGTPRFLTSVFLDGAIKDNATLRNDWRRERLLLREGTMPAAVISADELTD